MDSDSSDELLTGQGSACQPAPGTDRKGEKQAPAQHEKPALQHASSHRQTAADMSTPNKRAAANPSRGPFRGGKKQRPLPFESPVPAGAALCSEAGMQEDATDAQAAAWRIERPPAPGASNATAEASEGKPAGPPGEAAEPLASRPLMQDAAAQSAVPNAAGPSHANTARAGARPSKDSIRARNGQRLGSMPAAEPKPAVHKHAAPVIPLSLGSLQRPEQAQGSEPSSRQFFFRRKATAARPVSSAPGAVQGAASDEASAEDASQNQQDEGMAAEEQRSAGEADAHADIRLGAQALMADGPSKVDIEKPPGPAEDTQGEPSVPARDQPDGHADAHYDPPPPPVRSLDDDIAEQMQPGHQAPAAPAQTDPESSVRPFRQAIPGQRTEPTLPLHAQPRQSSDQPPQQAEAPGANEAGRSRAVAPGAFAGARRPAGTVADPVVISDSDSEEDTQEVRAFALWSYISICKKPAFALAVQDTTSCS